MATTAWDWFAPVQQAPPIEVFNLTVNYQRDASERKVLLGVGAYRDDNGNPWVLPVVRKAEAAIAADASLNKEYLPVLGLDRFSQLATTMILGEKAKPTAEGRVIGVQTLSGTGALRLAAEFLAHKLGKRVFYKSDPTWENHDLIFKTAGFTDARTYRYWCQARRGLDFDGLLADLDAAPEGAVVILHACAHNPTGCDPTQEQWARIADVVERRRLFPLFDSAYQGFATGDLDRDAWTVRYFLGRGFEMMVAQSFAKNFGLYNERVGNLVTIVNNAARVAAVRSQLTLTVRAMYSNPPSHGVRVVAHVLSDAALYAEWRENIAMMSERIRSMREALRRHLEALGTPGTWEHITTQIGMFSYTGLNERQVQRMMENHHVYMLRSGRISMAGVTSNNVEYVAKAIHETITSLPDNKL